jgi:hypothetical protein
VAPSSFHRSHALVASAAARRLAVGDQEVPGRPAVHGEQATALDADPRAAQGLTQHRQPDQNILLQLFEFNYS